MSIWKIAEVTLDSKCFPGLNVGDWGQRNGRISVIHKLLRNSTSFLIWSGISFHPLGKIFAHNQDVAGAAWALRSIATMSKGVTCTEGIQWFSMLWSLPSGTAGIGLTI